MFKGIGRSERFFYLTDVAKERGVWGGIVFEPKTETAEKLKHYMKSKIKLEKHVNVTHFSHENEDFDAFAREWDVGRFMVKGAVRTGEVLLGFGYFNYNGTACTLVEKIDIADVEDVPIYTSTKIHTTCFYTYGKMNGLYNRIETPLRNKNTFSCIYCRTHTATKGEIKEYQRRQKRSQRQAIRIRKYRRKKPSPKINMACTMGCSRHRFLYRTSGQSSMASRLLMVGWMMSYKRRVFGPSSQVVKNALQTLFLSQPLSISQPLGVLTRVGRQHSNPCEFRTHKSRVYASFRNSDGHLITALWTPQKHGEPRIIHVPQRHSGEYATELSDSSTLAEDIMTP